MLKIGITGNIGAGKTLVCSIFELLGIPVYYADQRAKRLMVEDAGIVNEIIAIFGKKAYLKSGALNREFISSIVFDQSDKLEELNALVHPAVGSDFETWAIGQNAPYVLKEAALLFEAKSYLQLHKTVLVVADQEKRLQRVMSRDKVTEEAVLKRMRNQMPQHEKEKLADYIIDNNGTRSLVKQALDLHSKFIGLGTETSKK